MFKLRNFQIFVNISNLNKTKKIQKKLVIQLRCDFQMKRQPQCQHNMSETEKRFDGTLGRKQNIFIHKLVLVCSFL